MTTYNHTDISVGAAANAATFNSPLGELDAAIKKNEWAKTTAPGTSNDSTQGYSVGSRWVDTTAGREYVCVNPAAGAAVWLEITTPARTVAFLAYLSATVNDVTGDGTSYSVMCDTEVFDRGNNLAAGLFTAPVTGIYLLGAAIAFDEVAVGHTGGFIRIITSNRNYDEGRLNFGAIMYSLDEVRLSMAVVADMDVGDIAYPVGYVTGSTKVVDIVGGSSITYFSGALLTR